MKKRLLFSLAALAGAYYAFQAKSKEDSRFENAARVGVQNGRESLLDHTIKEAGLPEQMEEQDAAQLENAKMVSEGSQFGVQYYNKLKEEENTTS